MLLNCHSWFSLKYGTLSPEKLLEELAAKATELTKNVDEFPSPLYDLEFDTGEVPKLHLT